MKYIKPEINLELFEREDIVTTLSTVEDRITGGSGGLKLDGNDNISESNLFSFEW